jgi:hypothetical protein
VRRGQCRACQTMGISTYCQLCSAISLSSVMYLVSERSSAPTSSQPEPIRPWEGATIFHSEWWLDAVAPGEWRKLEVAIGGRTVGVLPIWERPTRAIKRLALPPFTPILGPAIDVGDGGESTRMHRHFEITSDLLAQVPRAATFKQVLDWTTPDVVAFQAAGYRTRPLYTILVD